MVYGRRSSGRHMYGYPKRRRFGQRRGFRRGVNYMHLAKNAFWMAKKAVMFLNSEEKFADSNANAASVGTTPIVTAMTGGLVRGTGENQRVGSSILLKSGLLRGTIKVNASATTPQQFRLIIFRDLNDNDNTAPTGAQLLQTTAAQAAILSPLNRDNSSRFQVIRDRIFRVYANHPSQSINEFFTFGFDKDSHGNNTKGQHATWDASDGTAAGQVYWMVVSSDDTNKPTMDWYSRYNYMDN